MQDTCVVIVAAGMGSRYDPSCLLPPKQFLFLGNVISKFLSIDSIVNIVCVVPEKYLEQLKSDNKLNKVSFVSGGGNRQESVFLGLSNVSNPSTRYVLIHDAARPYVSVSLIKNIIEKLRHNAIAVIPAVIPVDSVRILNFGVVNRNDVYLVQTPQGFLFDVIYDLHKKHRGANLSDDASLCDLEGITVNIINGEVSNKKITYQSDVLKNNFKIGFGFDSHDFSDDVHRKLKLCGVCIEEERGLVGVSDADVAIHSVVDAILGSLGEGSIGEHFPENEPSSYNADSMLFLENVRKMVYEKNFNISNLDITIVCDKVRIVNYRFEMQKNIANALGIDESFVNIKGKTTEGTSIRGVAAFTNILMHHA